MCCSYADIHAAPDSDSGGRDPCWTQSTGALCQSQQLEVAESALGKAAEQEAPTALHEE